MTYADAQIHSLLISKKLEAGAHTMYVQVEK